MELNGAWRAAHADDDLRRDAIGLEADDSAWAEITVPGMYRHVTNKESLLVEVAQRALSRYRLAGEFRDDARVADQLADLIVAFSTRRDRVSRRLGGTRIRGAVDSRRRRVGDGLGRSAAGLVRQRWSRHQRRWRRQTNSHVRPS